MNYTIHDKFTINEALCHLDDNDEFTKNVKSLCARYVKRAGLPECGRNRLVFDMGKYVVKIPRTYAGISDNDWEGSVSNEQETDFMGDTIMYARTRIASYKQIPIVLMEKVKHLSQPDIVLTFGREPNWCSFVDCGQVGINSKRQLVAYDYGYN